MKITREMLLDNIKPVIINVKDNEEMLDQIVHEKFGEFAVYLKLQLLENACIKIRHEFLPNLDVTQEQLFEQARSNLRAEMTFQSLESHIMKDFPEMERDIDTTTEMGMPPALYVLTNQELFEGAALISDPIVMEDIREKIGEDFYILPSSLHEVLIVKKSEMEDPCFLEDMVQDINQNEVAPADWLADHIYECDGNSLEMVDTRQFRLEQEEMGMDINII